MANIQRPDNSSSESDEEAETSQLVSESMIILKTYVLKTSKCLQLT